MRYYMWRVELLNRKKRGDVMEIDIISAWVNFKSYSIKDAIPRLKESLNVGSYNVFKEDVITSILEIENIDRVCLRDFPAIIGAEISEVNCKDYFVYSDKILSVVNDCVNKWRKNV
jgi:hypothetical protein